ncbi:MAG TPA: LuxR C-terminal-related transcriptional regulator, partial [Pseudoneobacillus sp.]|nr:LuxR C-terminal-related transcriptional regulator [Pseudoneobacillus sp.]
GHLEGTTKNKFIKRESVMADRSNVECFENSEIAENLFLSEGTVKNYKFEIHDRVKLATKVFF